MSKIKELRENENTNISLVNIFEKFSKGKTKYVELFVRLFMKSLIDREQLLISASKICEDKSYELNDLELTFIDVLLNPNNKHTYFRDILITFYEFVKYNEMNLIEDTDFQKYPDIDYLDGLVEHARNKYKEKLLEKQIKRLYEDDKWLLLIPLSHVSSCKYGANTKWCTASISNKSTFYDYAGKGVLIYIIKKNQFKVAAYHKFSHAEISFWDEEDKKVDSLTFNFPDYIMNQIKTELFNRNNIYVGDSEEEYDEDEPNNSDYGMWKPSKKPSKPFDIEDDNPFVIPKQKPSKIPNTVEKDKKMDWAEYVSANFKNEQIIEKSRNLMNDLKKTGKKFG